MRLWLSLFRIRLVCSMQYRAVALGSILTRFVWGLMEIIAFHTLHQNVSAFFSMTFSETVTYIWMQQALYAVFQVVYSDQEFAETIRNGSISYELVRPLKLYDNWFIQCMANRIAPTMLSCIPVLIISAFMPSVFRPKCPSVFYLLLFVISTVLALSIVAAMALLMHISLFYTISPRGIRIIITAVTTFLSGGVIPLPYFPSWLLKISEFLPFAPMQNTPLLIFCGSLTCSVALQSIMMQCVWLVVLTGVGNAILNRTLSKVVVQGG